MSQEQMELQRTVLRDPIEKVAGLLQCSCSAVVVAAAGLAHTPSLCSFSGCHHVPYLQGFTAPPSPGLCSLLKPQLTLTGI